MVKAPARYFILLNRVRRNNPHPHHCEFNGPCLTSTRWPGAHSKTQPEPAAVRAKDVVIFLAAIVRVAHAGRAYGAFPNKAKQARASESNQLSVLGRDRGRKGQQREKQGAGF